MPFIIGPQLLLIIAYSILFNKAANIEDNVALCYFCIFLACIGIYPILPGVNAVSKQMGKRLTRPRGCQVEFHPALRQLACV